MMLVLKTTNLHMIEQELIQKNKERLFREKKHLENLLSRVAERDTAAGDYHPQYPEFGDKEDENASEVAAYETNIAQERDLIEKLRKVEKALKRIEDKTYGVCQNCGQEIPSQRLEVVPEAENCIKHEPR